METVGRFLSEERRQKILDAINAEVARQGRGNTSIDAATLAAAVDAALGGDTLEAGPNPADTKGPAAPGSSPKGAYARTDEGKTPDQLDASNDD